jgi:hypothetical protein
MVVGAIQESQRPAKKARTAASSRTPQPEMEQLRVEVQVSSSSSSPPVYSAWEQGYARDDSFIVTQGVYAGHALLPDMLSIEIAYFMHHLSMSRKFIGAHLLARLERREP